MGSQISFAIFIELANQFNVIFGTTFYEIGKVFGSYDRTPTLSLIKIHVIVSERNIQILIDSSVTTSRIGKYSHGYNFHFLKKTVRYLLHFPLLNILREHHSSDKGNLYSVHSYPHTSCSIGRCIRQYLSLAGINTIFSVHSTHASTCATYRLHVSIDIIQTTAGWSSGSSHFAGFV